MTGATGIFVLGLVVGAVVIGIAVSRQMESLKEDVAISPGADDEEQL
ncbi:MAG TPA: hypothetical protein VFA85_19240 [Terriglobales bacterium]|nr:hypothetical protein [Terriglobales bacterium]